MKQLNSGLFQRMYHHLEEPVEVTAHGRALGTWFPAGTGGYAALPQEGVVAGVTRGVSVTGTPIAEAPETYPSKSVERRVTAQKTARDSEEMPMSQRLSKSHMARRPKG